MSINCKRTQNHFKKIKVEPSTSCHDKEKILPYGVWLYRGSKVTKSKLNHSPPTRGRLSQWEAPQRGRTHCLTGGTLWRGALCTPGKGGNPLLTQNNCFLKWKCYLMKLVTIYFILKICKMLVTTMRSNALIVNSVIEICLDVLLWKPMSGRTCFCILFFSSLVVQDGFGY